MSKREPGELMVRVFAFLVLLVPAIVFGGEWPATPPRIGRLVMPQEYWIYTLGAARDYGVSPYLIQGVMAIESRYDPCASSGKGRCQGLMQLDREASRGINPWDPRENIRRGAQILAKLIQKYDDDLPRAVRAYNGTGNRAYEREVLRAIRQAEKGICQ